MNNNNEEYGIELKLLTSKFKAKMQETSNSVKQWANSTKNDAAVSPDIEVTDAYTKLKQLQVVISSLKKEMKDLDPNSAAFIEFSNQLKDAENEAKELNRQLKKTNTLEFPTKKASKFLLSLFSIRTAWSLISKAASTYIGENETLNQQIQLTSSLLGNTLAPIIQQVLNVAQYAAIVVSELIRVFTGYDAVAGAVANANKKIASSGKQASKSLASFDTISNLADSSSSSSSNITAMTDALTDFKEKVEQVRAVFDKYEPTIKAAAVALGVFAGAAMLGKLATMYGSLKTLLGVAGTGAAAAGATGLLGVLGVLTAIAAIGVITVSVVTVYEEKNKTDEAVTNAMKTSNSVTEVQIKTMEQYKKAYEDGTVTLEQYTKFLKENIKTSEEEAATILGQLDSMNALDKLMGKITGSTEMLTNEVSNNNEVIKQNLEYYGKLYKNGKLTTDQQSEYKKMLEEAIPTLEEYGTDVTNLKNDYESLSSKEYTISVNADTSKAKSSISTFFSSLGTKLQASGILGGVGLSLKNLFNSFDVGTNYVPNDQLAMIHKGEMIVPAKYNPATSNVSGNEETNYLLSQLLTTLENKNFNVQIGEDAVGKASVNYINKKSRQIGGSVIK